MKDQGNLARGLVAGVCAGLAASFVMNEFQALWTALKKNSDTTSGEPSTLKLANKLSVAASGQPVPKRAEETASNAVHYATGAALGAFYGVVAEFAPGIRSGVGSGYAGAVWGVLDNGVLPSLNLAPKPSKIALETQAYSFASHMVFGVVLELSRRVFASVL